MGAQYHIDSPDHSDQASQYVAISYTERLAAAVIQPSVASVGNSYDNALAETINCLCKAELFTGAGRGGPSRMSNLQPCPGSTGSITGA
jgi:transposase InsO family protein